MALLAGRGVEVTICCSTRGEGGVTGDPPVCRRGRNWARCREAELRCAAAVLGAGSVVFLGYVDPPVAPGQAASAATTDVAGVRRPHPGPAAGAGPRPGHHPRLQRRIRASPARGHPSGRAGRLAAVGAARRRAVHLRRRRRARPLFRLLPQRVDPPTVDVDIAPVLAAKHRAFACHATQVATTLKDAGLASMEGMFPPWESFRRRRGPPLLERWLGLPVDPAGPGTAARRETSRTWILPEPER